MGGLTRPRLLSTGDDRQAFDSGHDVLNTWFRRHAWRNHHSDVSRVTVACDASDGTIVGYVVLCAVQIERAYLPRTQQRNMPDPIPVILLGQLAVDVGYQKRGIGKSLLRFAFEATVRFSSDIGCFGLLTHPLNDQARAFYSRLGFEELPLDPKRSMIARTIDLKRNEF
jgi:ribosomal protein S18 acetylase RimI-like enzyme